MAYTNGMLTLLTAITWAASVAWLKANAGVLMTILGWPLLSAALNYANTRMTPEAWEAWAMTHPELAKWATRLRGFGVDPRMITKAGEEYARRKAGLPGKERLTVEDALKEALMDPNKRAQLEAVAKTFPR